MQKQQLLVTTEDLDDAKLCVELFRCVRKTVQNLKLDQALPM